LPLLLAARVWAAGEAALDLRWRAPAGCSPEVELRAEVERLVGHPVPAGEAPALRAEAAVGGVEGAWRVRLRTSVDGADGEKWLEAPSCRSLADAVALVVALAYDPQALAARAEGPAQAPTEGVGATPPVTAVAPGTEGDRAKKAPSWDKEGPFWRPSAHVAFVANAGSLPTLAPGLGIGAGLASSSQRPRSRRS
jgi:hypothetical protein